MTAAELLKTARADGVQFILKADGLSIRADAQKQAKWVQILRPHKADLLALLAQETAPQSGHVVASEGCPQGVMPSQTTMIKPGQSTLLSATPGKWRAVRDAYYDHHRRCPGCISAGKGAGLRCGAGSALWAAYAATPPPFV